MNVGPLNLWGDVGTLTASQNDANFKTLRDFANALASLLGVALSGDTEGALGDGAINNENQIVDRIITQAKLSWLWAPYGTATGTNSYSVNIPPGTPTYAAGLTVFVRFQYGNTGASTINLNLAGAVPMTKHGGDALVSGDIQNGQVCVLVYYGTGFEVFPLRLTAANIGHTAFKVTTSSGLPVVATGATEQIEFDVLDGSFDNSEFNTGTFVIEPDVKAVYYLSALVRVQIAATPSGLPREGYLSHVRFWDYGAAAELFRATGEGGTASLAVSPVEYTISAEGMFELDPAASAQVGVTIENTTTDPLTVISAEFRGVKVRVV